MHPYPRRRISPTLLALLLFLTGACRSEGGEVRAAQDPAQTPGAAEDQVVDLAALGFNEGDEGTSLYGVIEFADFGCVYCAEFHAQTFPALHEEFVASGEVLWKYIPITIGGFPNGRLAGLSGVCAGILGDFGPLRDRLYEEREGWMASEEAEALFVGYAVSVGLEAEAFRSCLQGEEAAAQLDTNDQMARTIGVTGTPTFIIRGIPVRGAPMLSEFRAALRQLSDEVRAEMERSQGN